MFTVKMHLRLILLLHYSCLVTLLLPSSTSGELPDHDEIRRFLIKGNDTTNPLSYHQLKLYFQHITGLNDASAADTPRLFPLCIDASTLENSPDDRIQRFAPVWKAMEKGPCGNQPLRFHEFNESEHSMLKNRDWIDTLEFTRVNSDDNDARNMRQWMHITIKAKKSLKAVYLQTIVGNMGLPSGEFSLEFPCSDLVPGSSVIDNTAKFYEILHCDYRSRAGLSHPNALFAMSVQGRDQFYVRYKWTDISCLETPFLQFLIVVVENFTSDPMWGVDFQPLLSPVYSNVEFDSKDGIMTPYYVDWENKMTCNVKSNIWMTSTKSYHDSKFEALKWQETTIRRLQFNEDYEKCIMGKGSGQRDENRKECAPGPFECPAELNIKAVSDGSGFQAVVDRRKAELKDAQLLDDCIPCFFPSIEELNCTGELGEEVNFVGKGAHEFLHLDYSEYFSSSLDSKIHGAMAVLVYCLLVPVSIMIGRFYRGIPIRGKPSDNSWIMIHGAIQGVAYLLMWISTGFVTTLYEGIDHTSQDCLKEAEEIVEGTSGIDKEWTQDSFMEWLDNCAKNRRSLAHSILGILTFFIHNLVVFLSFARSRSEYIRNIQVIIHSHLGYLVPILASVSIFVAVKGEHCTEELEFTIVLMTFNVLGFIIASFVTSAEDKSLNINPRRYKWPILEPVRLSHPGPMHECKIGLISVYAGLQLFVWILAVIALSRIALSEDKALSGIEQGKIIAGIFKSCKSPTLFRPKMFD